MSKPESTLPQDAFHRLALVMAIGWLVTNLALDIADLPFKFLLKERVGLDAAGIAAFFAIGNFTNYIKPIAGVLTDSVPLRGTRRRHYLLLGVGGGGLFWLLLGVVPRTHASLLITYTLFYITVVLTSTSLGGRMVEAGQEYGAAGRLTAQRIGMFRLASLAGGVIGGWLAARPFGLTMAISAALHFGLFGLLVFALPEARLPRQRSPLRREAVIQLRALLQCRPLLAAAGMIFLIAVAPGYGTPLLFYQTDVLHFSKRYIGLLSSCGAAAGLLGAYLYLAGCRRLPLRVLLGSSIVVHACGTLLFLLYRSAGTAFAITMLSGITGTLAMLPVYDLAARATPRGSEAMGYAVMMSVWNATSALSDWSGSMIQRQYALTFRELVWVNAGTTALALIAIPFLPSVLMLARDGSQAVAAPPSPAGNAV